MVVQCTWKPKDGRDVGDAVSWSFVDDVLKNDLEDDVQAENCLLLTAPSTGSSEYLTVPACQLLLSCQQPDQIEYLTILSEAKVLEVYGHHGEYIKTVRNELIEEVEDMSVYRGDIRLERPLQVCSIKFACLQSKNEMWLYGIRVRVTKAPETPDNELKIQFLKVEQRLQEMGLELSDKAEAFKQLVLCHQQSTSKLGQHDMNNFVQVLKLLNLTQGKSIGSPSSIGNFLTTGLVSPINRSNKTSPAGSVTDNNIDVPTATKPVTKNIVAVKSASIQTDDPPPKNELDKLKDYIDGKLEELGRQIHEKLEKQFQESEAKIMCKLEEIESFVKPQGIQGKT